MPIDVSRVVQAALEAATQGPDSNGEQPKKSKPHLSGRRALLIGAGLVTVGRLAAPKGREMLDSLQQKLEEFESDTDDEQHENDQDYDEGPEGEGDEDFDDDEEPEGESDEDFDDDEEPEGESDEDFDAEEEEHEPPRQRKRTKSRARTRS